MVPIVIGKCNYSYFLEFGYSFFIVGAKPHSSAALLHIYFQTNDIKVHFLDEKVKKLSGMGVSK